MIPSKPRGRSQSSKSRCFNRGNNEPGNSARPALERATRLSSLPRSGRTRNGFEAVKKLTVMGAYSRFLHGAFIASQFPTATLPEEGFTNCCLYET